MAKYNLNTPSLQELIAGSKTTPLNIEAGVDNFVAQRQLAEKSQLEGLKQKLAEARALQQQQKEQQALELQKQTLGLGQSKLAEEMRHNKATEATAGKKADKPGSDLTPGEKALDEAFAKKYSEDLATGGAANTAAVKSRIQDAYNNYTKLDVGLGTRAASTFLPDKMAGFVAPEITAAEQDARSAVLGSLRATLGAQFTEREGERIFSQTFDPSLPKEVTQKRLKRLMEITGQAAEAKSQATKYFRDNGTLKGYTGKLPSDYEAEFSGLDSGGSEDKKAALRAKLGLPNPNSASASSTNP